MFAVDDALSQLATREPVIARLVELRFFAGLTLPEAAKCLGISERTAYRQWAYAYPFQGVSRARFSASSRAVER